MYDLVFDSNEIGRVKSERTFDTNYVYSKLNLYD